VTTQQTPLIDGSGTCALVVFAKAPTPGRVKTRLVPPLTPARAARLHRAFIEDTLSRVAARPWPWPGPRYLACAPATGDPFLIECARRYGADPIAQGPGDLGARMRRVVQALLKRHAAVVVIGSDSPTLPPMYLDRACAALRSVDLVFGPSDDGGYYLVGQRCLEPDLFRDIPWGTADVLEATLARLDPRRVALLPPWYDVDRPDDLERLRRELDAGAACPRTRAVLRSWERRPVTPRGRDRR